MQASLVKESDFVSEGDGSGADDVFDFFLLFQVITSWQEESMCMRESVRENDTYSSLFVHFSFRFVFNVVTKAANVLQYILIHCSEI